MNQCMWVLIAFVIVVLVVLYINYLITLHGRVRRLEHRTSPQLAIIEREVHGIGCYMRIIIGIAIFFCVCVSVHYLCYCHPHFVDEQAPKPDSLGTVVTIFGIVVTLLVGWQIYSTIKAREELRTTKNEIEEHFKEELNVLKDCCKERGTQIKEIESMVGTISKEEADRAANESSFISLAQLGNIFFNRLDIEKLKQYSKNVEHNNEPAYNNVQKEQMNITPIYLENLKFKDIINEAQSAITLLFNAASLWDKNFNSELATESFSYLRNRLETLCNTINPIQLETDEEKRVYQKAALNLNSLIINNYVLNITVANPSTDNISTS